MFTVHYMSTKVHDEQGDQQPRGKGDKIRVNQSWRVTRSKKSRGLRVWKSTRHGMHAVKIEIVS